MSFVIKTIEREKIYSWFKIIYLLQCRDCALSRHPKKSGENLMGGASNNSTFGKNIYHLAEHM
jgi:hypothetical protein